MACVFKIYWIAITLRIKNSETSLQTVTELTKDNNRYKYVINRTDDIFVKYSGMRPCHKSETWVLAFHCGVSGSILGDFMRDLWWAKWVFLFFLFSTPNHHSTIAPYSLSHTLNQAAHFPILGLQIWGFISDPATLHWLLGKEVSLTLLKNK